MQIAFAASECAPFSKTGGLADVVGALPNALRSCGDEAAVSVFVEWLWTGSSASRVITVEVTDADAGSVRPGFRTA